jgi:hypothetical protein
LFLKTEYKVPKALQTKPFDVAVAIRLLRAASTFAELAADLASAPSQVYAATRRLELAGLLKPEQRATNARALVDFLLGGVRYAFPAQRGPLVTGIPTAYSASPLNAVVDAIDVVVWPAPKLAESVRGFSLTPLFPRAPLLAQRDPQTYRVLTVVDALRLGDPRLRPYARDALEALVSG